MKKQALRLDRDGAARRLRSVPLLRAFWIQPFLRFFQERGVPVEKHLKDARLPASLVETSELPCPSLSIYELIDKLVRGAGVSDVGLKVGAKTRIRSLGRFGHEVANAATLGDAIRTASRLMPAVHTGRRLSLSWYGPEAQLSSRLDEAQASPAPWEDQFVLLLMVDLVRMAAGPGWRPKAVAVPTRGFESLRDCQALSNAKLIRGADGATVVFPRALLGQPLVHGAPVSVSESGVNRRFDAGPLPTDLTSSLQAALECLMIGGHTDLDSAVRVVDTSRRTLQRCLRAVGDTFSQVLARTRLAQARRLLGEPSLNVIDVAFELGYSDHSHFTKAFRAWTGFTPRAYRNGGDGSSFVST